MLFNSGIFIFVFLPLVLAVFFALGRLGRREFALGWLALASLFYYAWWNPVYLPLLLASIGFNYTCGVVLGHLHARGGRGSKTALVFGIGANLALLGYYKYAGFFARTVNGLFGASWAVGDIILPLAISFFTFQQIAYLVDAYRGETREYNFLHYTLFVTYYPQLIAGPIVHHREMLPQFAGSAPYRWNAHNMAVGLTLFSMGLCKKVLLADGVSVYASPVFAAAARGVPLTLIESWGGVLAYAFQIYFDFSGYSDMAVGLGKMCGIDLPLNFNSPYKATGLIEFWKRWHMTLSRFLRDYLYIPLGGSRRGASRRYANLMATMTLGGLWHGAGWTFVGWGALHGVFLVINHGWRHLIRNVRPVSRWHGPAARAGSRAASFAAVLFAWALFRAETMGAARGLFAGLLGLNGLVLPQAWQGWMGPLGGVVARVGGAFGPLAHFHGLGEALILAGLLAIAWGLPNTQEIVGSRLRGRPGFDGPNAARPSWLTWSPSLPWALCVALLAGCAFVRLTVSRVTEFLYYQF